MESGIILRIIYPHPRWGSVVYPHLDEVLWFIFTVHPRWGSVIYIMVHMNTLEKYSVFFSKCQKLNLNNSGCICLNNLNQHIYFAQSWDILIFGS